MSPTLLLALAGLGFVGAFVSGLVGVGGAIVMIPLLFYVPPLLGVGSLDIKAVAGITMAQVFAASLLGAWIHGRVAMLHRPLALIGGSGMALGSLVGAVGSRYVAGRLLLVVFGTMSVAALLLMFLSPASAADSTTADAVPVNRVAIFVYPSAIGLMAGLVGAGGAFLLVPVLTGLLGIPLRVTIGTSLAMTTVSALTGFVGKLLTAQVPLWPTMAVVAGALLGAPLGARLSRVSSVRVLRGLLALLIGLTALRVWADVLFR